MATGLAKRTLLVAALTGAFLAIAPPAPARAVECAGDARKAHVRIELWKEPCCHGAWIGSIRRDGDRPDSQHGNACPLVSITLCRRRAFSARARHCPAPNGSPS